MKPTIFIVINRAEFKVVDRGDMGTIDLLNVLKTIRHGLMTNHKKIDNSESESTVCKMILYPFSGGGKSEITTGGFKVAQIVDCIEEIQKKYAREILGEVSELQGILKGKDLERYLDQMIKQNEAKGNQNN